MLARKSGAPTSAPVNHDSGAGQYSLIAIPLNQRPRADCTGGGGIALEAAGGTTD